MIEPLPLTPFETYYWTDARPDYPMTFPFDLRFAGRLDRPRFERALAVTLDRHPLLGCRIEIDPPGPRWVQTPDGPWLDWAEDGAPLSASLGEFIDLSQSTGLRVHVRARDVGSRVIAEFHHACCDGLGALAFLEDLMIAYARQCTEADNAPPLRPLDSSALAHRGNFMPAAARPPLRIALRDVWITIRLWAGFMLRQPARLAGNPPNPGCGRGEFVSEVVSSEMMSGLRTIAVQQGAMLNDLLLRDLFTTIESFNRQAGGKSRDRIWLNVPVNLRGRHERTLPAANRLALCFVGQPPAAAREPHAALLDIHRQTEQIKQWKLGLYFLGGLAFACRFPKLLRWGLHGNRSFATMVLSNVGRAWPRSALRGPDGRFVCGNVVLEQVTGVPPVRPQTHGAIGILEYAGRWVINLRCDPKRFDLSATRALLKAYVAQLHETLRRGV